MQSLFTHRYFIVILLIILSAMSIADLVVDHHEGAGLEHMAQEGVLLLLCLIAVASLLLGFRRQSNRIAGLKQELVIAAQEVAKASDSLKDGRLAFAKVIAEQFTVWGLSKSEHEIGFLVLKGFSLAEIASLRETKEKTVRQQASAVYKKAGVSGRHAFSAWFIEDYM